MKKIFLAIVILFTIIRYNNSEKKNKEVKTIESVKLKDSLKENRPIDLVKAPDFSLADINGKRFDLSDFKGKYVYMDIWATWCGPCKVQIPFMKQLEEEFRDAPIHFVSISVDSEDDKPVWAKMVRENEMSGVQLFAGRENNFGYDYKIQYIPTFIILDKEGNIMNLSAPSLIDYQTGEINTELVDLFRKMK